MAKDCISAYGHAMNTEGKCALCGKVEGRCYSCNAKLKNPAYNKCFMCSSYMRKERVSTKNQRDITWFFKDR